MTKTQLIEDNINLVYSLITREYPTFINDEDIVQCGMLGLCQAADKWEEDRGKFSAFAWCCIRNEIIREFRRRAKHQGVWSLDYEITDNDGDRCSFGDLVIGEPDVLYIDDCSNQLTPLQNQILELLKQGMQPKDVAEALNTNLRNVYWTQRLIRILRGSNES